MAPMLFARAILAGEPIKVFNHGKMQRDFTYIDDIVEGCVAVTSLPRPIQSLIRFSLILRPQQHRIGFSTSVTASPPNCCVSSK